MNIVKLNSPINAREAEAVVVAELKKVLYQYSGVITVAQALGCIEIAKSEMYWEQGFNYMAGGLE